MTRLILVHGINHQDSSLNQVADEWLGALKAAWKKCGHAVDLGSVEIKCAFYGTLLYEETRTWTASKDIVEMSAEQGEEDDVLQLYQEYQSSLGISDEQIVPFADDKVVEFGFPHKGWVKAIARGLERISPVKGRYLARTYLPQAVAYLTRPGTADRIDNEVRRQVFSNPSPHEQVVVVAHSLGTVITYRLLRALRDEMPVNLYITLGSPLGALFVQKHLPVPRIRPRNVQRWVNGADRNDFVAIQPILNRKTFGTDEIENVDGIHNGDEDPHSIVAYLSDQRVCEVLAGALAKSG